jgi:hypothetical protein
VAGAWPAIDDFSHFDYVPAEMKPAWQRLARQVLIGLDRYGEIALGQNLAPQKDRTEKVALPTWFRTCPHSTIQDPMPLTGTSNR